jgi:hypothetical protein
MFVAGFKLTGNDGGKYLAGVLKASKVFYTAAELTKENV